MLINQDNFGLTLGEMHSYSPAWLTLLLEEGSSEGLAQGPYQFGVLLALP